jgi:hypothetical protein
VAATLGSDDDGRTWSDGPITANDIYAGETYDARLEQRGWDQAGFDASTWKSVTPLTPRHTPSARATGTSPHL